MRESLPGCAVRSHEKGICVNKAPGMTARELLCHHVATMANIAESLRDDLDANAVVVARPKGTVLFEEGTHCGGMVVLHEGVIRVSRQNRDGREFTVYRVRPAETCMITLSCVLSHLDYPARGVVEKDILGVLIPVPLFERLTNEVPEFRRLIFDSFAARLIQVVDLASSITFEFLPSRLAAALLGKRDGAAPDELVATHQDLATELGTVRERVSRVLESFESQGVVSLARGRIHITDAHRLEEIADPTY